MTTEEFQYNAEVLRQQLVSIARKYVGNTDEAEDVAQDAMVKLWLMHDKLVAPIGGIASVLTRNLCIDNLRRKHATVDISRLPEEEDFSDDGEQIEQMLQIIDTLPSTQRTILKMRHLQGMEMREIAHLKLRCAKHSVALVRWLKNASWLFLPLPVSLGRFLW